VEEDVLTMEEHENVGHSLGAVFGTDAEPFIRGVDTVLQRAKTHEYEFCSEEFFRIISNETPPNMGKLNYITAHELLEKCHLSAVTAIRRNRSWMHAAAREYANGNYYGFAASARGYIESVADSMDGLLAIGHTLARHHRSILACLSGKVNDRGADFQEIEQKLDHYMFAGWTREKDNVRKEKGSQVYIQGIQSSQVPNLLRDWRKLCAVAHPSSASVEIFYEFDKDSGRVRFLENAEAERCAEILEEIKPSLEGILPYAMNPSLLILRVMHKFPGYPKIPEMKKMAFDRLPIWSEISRML